MFLYFFGKVHTLGRLISKIFLTIQPQNGDFIAGLQLGDQLASIPDPSSSMMSDKGKTPVAMPGGSHGGGSNHNQGGGGGSTLSDADADLQARLDNLRRE